MKVFQESLEYHQTVDQSSDVENPPNQCVLCQYSHVDQGYIPTHLKQAKNNDGQFLNDWKLTEMNDPKCLLIA